MFSALYNNLNNFNLLLLREHTKFYLLLSVFLSVLFICFYGCFYMDFVMYINLG